MDGATAESLILAAENAQEKLRGGENAAGVEAFETIEKDSWEGLDWLLDQGRPDDAFRLSAALTTYWMASRRVDEGMAWLERALETGAGSPGARSQAHHDRGYLAFFSGNYEVAELHFAEARELAELCGDRDRVALALAGTARVQLNDDPTQAVSILRHAMRITDDTPYGRGRSSAEHVLGVALQLSADLDGARSVMRQRLGHARATGNDFVVVVESANLSMVERKRGNLDEAETLSREALRIVTRIGHEMAIPWVINGLAAVTAAQGRHDRAALLLAIAGSLLERAGGEWPADEREQYDGTLEAVSAALSPEELDEARTKAAAMPFDEAISVALT